MPRWRVRVPQPLRIYNPPAEDNECDVEEFPPKGWIIRFLQPLNGSSTRNSGISRKHPRVRDLELEADELSFSGVRRNRGRRTGLPRLSSRTSSGQFQPPGHLRRNELSRPLLLIIWFSVKMCYIRNPPLTSNGKRVALRIWYKFSGPLVIISGGNF